MATAPDPTPAHEEKEVDPIEQAHKDAQEIIAGTKQPVDSPTDKSANTTTTTTTDAKEDEDKASKSRRTR